MNMECALHYSKTTCASVTWHKAAGLQVLWQVVTGRLLFLLYFLISCVLNDFNVLFGAGVDITGIPFGLRSLSLNEVSGNR